MIKKSSIYCYSFALLAVISHSLDQRIIATLLCYVLVLIFWFKEYNSKLFYKIISPIFVLLLIGVFFFRNNEIKDVARDVFIITNPLIFFIFGSFIAYHNSFVRFISFIVYLGVVLSVIYFVQGFLKLGFNIFILDSMEIRVALGVGNGITAISLALLLVSGNYKTLQDISNFKYKYPFIFINSMAMIMFGSRTYYGFFILVFFALIFPILKVHKIRFLMLSILMAVIVVFILVRFKDNFVVDKMLNSVSEVSLTEDLDGENKYANYRGFETLAALNTYLNESDFLNYFFGLGLGHLVDLKMYIELSGTDFRYIPVLHNGYLYILVKTGLLGMIAFFIFFVKVYRHSKRNCQDSDPLLHRLIVGVLLGLLFSNFIISGFFNAEMETILIFLGFLIQSTIISKDNVIIESANEN